MPVQTFKICKRIVSGQNSFMENIGAEISRLGAKRVFLLCGKNIAKSGLPRNCADALKVLGIQTFISDGAQPEPKIASVENAVETAKSFEADCVLGIGGGSTLDAAKMCAALLTNKRSIHDLLGVEKIPHPSAPLILVPTTGGTGSEATDVAIVTDPEKNLKIGVVSQHLLPDSVILDPLLTVSLPPAATAASGLDALIHAMEAYTSVNANDLTDIWACQAMRLISGNLREAWARGANVDARAAMLTGSLYAGIAFCNAGVTAVHAFAYPIGARYHIAHGWANALMLLPVFRFNMLGNLERFAKIAAMLGANVEGLSVKQAAAKTVDALSDLMADLNAPKGLKEYGASENDIPELAMGVMEVKRLLANNPRTITYDDAIKIYREAM